MKCLKFVVFVALAAVLAMPLTVRAEKASKAELIALVHASGTVAMSGSILRIMPEQIMQAVRRKNPKIPAAFSTIVAEEFQREEKAFTREVVDMAAEAWGKYLTRDEVLELTRMYARPVFKKALQVMPKVMRENSARSQVVAKQLVERVMPRIKARAESELGLNLNK